MRAVAEAPAAERILVLEAGRAERHYWRDLWTYRELFAILAWRDLAVRYKQTVVGAAWAVIRPLLTMLIFTVIFGRIARMPTEGATPYPVLVFAGMLPWFLFSTILNDASVSLVTNANLIGKVYFPRLIVPAATIAVALVDFAVTFVLLIAMMIWFHVMPDWRLVFLPLFILLAILASLGPALWMTAMNVEYRDLPLHHPLHPAVRPLCFAGRLFEHGRAGSVAPALQSQPPPSASSTVSAGACWAGAPSSICPASPPASSWWRGSCG